MSGQDTAWGLTPTFWTPTFWTPAPATRQPGVHGVSRTMVELPAVLAGRSAAVGRLIDEPI
jgi:hypothetical protein